MSIEKINKDMLRTIGESLKKTRQEHKVTIREMAIKLGVTQNTIVNFEKGESNNLILFFNYCYLFNVKIGVNISNEDKRFTEYDI